MYATHDVKTCNILRRVSLPPPLSPPLSLPLLSLFSLSLSLSLSQDAVGAGIREEAAKLANDRVRRRQLLAVIDSIVSEAEHYRTSLLQLDHAHAPGIRP